MKGKALSPGRKQEDPLLTNILSVERQKRNDDVVADHDGDDDNDNGDDDDNDNDDDDYDDDIDDDDADDVHDVEYDYDNDSYDTDDDDDDDRSVSRETGKQVACAHPFKRETKAQ